MSSADAHLIGGNERLEISWLCVELEVFAVSLLLMHCKRGQLLIINAKVSGDLSNMSSVSAMTRSLSHQAGTWI